MARREIRSVGSVPWSVPALPIGVKSMSLGERELQYFLKLSASIFTSITDITQYKDGW